MDRYIDGDVVDGLKFVVLGIAPSQGKMDTVAVKKELGVSENKTSSFERPQQPSGIITHGFLKTINGIVKTNENNVFKKEDRRILSKDSLLAKKYFISHPPVSSASTPSITKKYINKAKI